MNAQQFSTSIPQIDSPANIKVTLSYLDTSHISQDNLAPSVNEPALPCTHDIPTPDTLTKQVHKDHNAVSCFACSKSFNDDSMDIGMSFLFLLFFFLSNFLFADKPAYSTSKIDASLAPISQPEFDTIRCAHDTISNTVILDLINEDATSSETSYRNSLCCQILDSCASL